MKFSLKDFEHLTHIQFLIKSVESENDLHKKLFVFVVYYSRTIK